jgi:NAD(P)-dependent dehydrogenase (short-subunit alcohol dehydrogenase family)
LKTERVLITGCGRGLGAALATAFASRGWDVIATCRTLAGAAELEALARRTPSLRIAAMDVADEQSIARLARAAGGHAIDVVISNAVFARREPDLASVDRLNWLEAMTVNAFAPLALARAFAPALARSARPRLVAIGSEMGSLTNNREGGRLSYRTSKAALNMVIRTLACDLASSSIICTSVHPGWVRTRLGGASAPLTPAAAASDLIDLIARLDASHNGCFVDRFGVALPW